MKKLLTAFLFSLLLSAQAADYTTNKPVARDPGTTTTASSAGNRVARSLFVDNVNGSDTSGSRGRRDQPFLTIAAALADAQSGDTVFVGVGSFAITNSLVVPAGVKLQGSGWDTIIVNYETNVVSSHYKNGITLSSRCTVSDLQVTNAAMDSFCQRCIGVDYLMGDTACTNATVARVLTYADCDNMYVAHTNICSADYFDSLFLSKWDCVAFFSGAHRGRLFNCFGYSTGPSVFSSAQGSHAITTSGGSTVTTYGGGFYVTNQTSTTAAAQLGASGDGLISYGTIFSADGGANAVPFLGAAGSYRNWQGGPDSSSIAAYTASVTLTNQSFRVGISSSTGIRTLTLPATPKTGQQFHIKKTSSDSNIVTIDGNGNTIEGSSTLTLTNQYDKLNIWWNGSAWLKD